MGFPKWILAGLVACLVLVGSAAAQWQEPADGSLTEKQMDGFLAVMADLREDSGDGEAFGMAAAMVAAIDGGDAIQASLAKHDMAMDEFNWVSAQVMEAWGVATIADLSDESKDEMAEQIEDAMDEVAVAEEAVEEADQALTAASDDAAKAAAALDKEEAEATLELQEAGLAQIKATNRLLAVQAERITASTNEANVMLVRKHKAEIDEIIESEEAGGEVDEEAGGIDGMDESPDDAK